jgi:hypothetical protein
MELIQIPIDEIDLNERSLKISRNRIDDGFRASIREFGILDPPAVIGEKSPYRAVFGHNRLVVLAELGGSHAICERRPGLDEEWYPGKAILKCARDEAGPAGRLRILRIAREMLHFDRAPLLDFATRGLRVPAAYAADNSLLDKVLGLPAVLLDYLDYRDVPFRLIRELARLTDASIARLSEWIAVSPLGLNIFRALVEMLADIEEGGGAAGLPAVPAPAGVGDRAGWEEGLRDAVFTLRYPGLSAARRKADDVVRYCAARGVTVEYPPYFEGDAITIRLALRKGEEPESLRGRFNGIDLERLREILDLL